MKYLSVCSGIEAATAAWHPLGWEPIGFSEIEPFPSAVLAHHYPNVPNYGDMTKFKEWNIEPGSIDLLVGGTPCQSFSIAGLRKGLKDPRGNLMLTYGAIADHLRPKWIVWENVPGVLSSFSCKEPPSDLQEGQEWETTEKSDFGGFLAMLAELGYGFAYRILDAQFIRVESHPRAVPQRRRRVFVVGYLGDWRRAASVLFESESLSRYTPPSRKAGERTSRGIEIGPSGGGFTEVNPTLDTRAKDGPIRNQLAGAVMQVSHTLNAKGGTGRIDSESEDFIPVLMDQGGSIIGIEKGISGTLRRESKGHEPIIAQSVSGTLQNNGKAAGSATQQDAENGMLIPIGFHNRQDPCVTKGFSQSMGSKDNGLAVGYHSTGAGFWKEGSGTLRARDQESHEHLSVENYKVRRLTPEECERLQGFPTGYTRIPWRNKPVENCPDGPRYKAIGNSMAVNVMRWIGYRIKN